MQTPNSMIVRGQALPVPPPQLKRYFGGLNIDRSRQVSVAGLNIHFALHPEASPFATIGRSDDCDIQLDHPDVSFRHAHLQLVAGYIYCIDLASRTGTYWDGINLPAGWLMPGRAVRIGPYSLTASGNSAEETDRRVTNLNLLSHEIADPDIELEILNGTNLASGRTSWTVRQPITLIGSSPQCRLRLKDGGVSRVHCSLMATPAGLWVTDLLGRGGTRVNGEPVTFQPLRHDDELVVGQFRFRVRCLDEEDVVVHESTDPFRSSTDAAPGPERQRPVQPAGGSGGVSEGFVLSMMDRFLEMQQQMSAINHQQMMFMAQLVGSMHQNHHDLAQRELARIAEIGAEIRKLQELAAAQGTPVPASPPLPRVEDIAAAAPPPPQNLLDSAPGVPVAEPASFRPDAYVAEAASFRPDAGSVGHVSDAAANQPRFTPRDVNSHSSIIERMAALEKERSSRWKKLVGLLTGSGS
jgi:pSer/pThr/pTyr-binding forkhead associated (FHA) protein